MKTLLSILVLARPVNVVITIVAVVVGGIIASGNSVVDSFVLWLAGISAGLVAGGGNTLNDYYDTAIDRINRPDRPIPSGKVSQPLALTIGIARLALGVAIGAAIDLRLGILAVVVAGLLWLYSAHLKRTPLLGNLTVALCAAATLVYGSIAVQQPFEGLIPAIFALMIHLAREIVKDCEDIKGDGAVDAKTLPLSIGMRNTQVVIGVIMLILIAMLPVPFFIGALNIYYLILVIITVGIPLSIMSSWMFRGVKSTGLHRASLVLKLSMIGGLISLYVG